MLFTLDICLHTHLKSECCPCNC